MTEITVQDEPIVRNFLYTVQVKFHNTSKSYTFGTDIKDLEPGVSVVVETSQGIELGVCQSNSVSLESHPTSLVLSPVLRIAEEEDLKNFEMNFLYAKDALKVCQEEVSDLGLEMRLLSATYVLDRTKILIVYMADQRVDFRELLKRLGARLRCRIELRQIGDRDKAKMIGGIGICGRECCCSRFKEHFDIISINMAKNQQLALNIEKLSGMCGKLMCCLKYEDEFYKEKIEGLPKLGGHVEYEEDLYKVTSINVIANEARIENSETYQILTLDELRQKAIIRKGVSLKKPGDNRRRNVKVVKSAEIEAKHAAVEEKPEKKAEPVQVQPARNVQKHSKPERPREERKEPPKQAKKERNDRRDNQKRPRRQESLTENKNPNITVRSFKSSKHKNEG
ncbi:MAG: hypothetical protein IKE36_11625 [Solobacterium sp.]|nr:hypothetical protein [Solobacterium sp.]